jgi:polysaccharide export outer membrane protein
VARRVDRISGAVALALALCACGCATIGNERLAGARCGNGISPNVPVAPPPIPRELQKSVLPDYVIEPPDILLIDAVRVVPKPPYRLNTLDVVHVQVVGTFPDQSIDGPYTVETGGAINLGPSYGTVAIAGKTLEEATAVVEERLSLSLRAPIVSMQLLQSAGEQQIGGEHAVGPDGMVSLGTYGKALIAGMTQQQARTTIEAHLSQFLDNPQVSVEIYAYNSKVYYLITQGAGLGDGVSRFPITGNETVLDAIADVNGLESVSSKRIWVARPSPLGGPDQVLPVDWRAISERGKTDTNYQLMPGDRVFIAEDKLVAVDTFVSKVLSPLERIAGFVSLGTQTSQNIRFYHRGTNNISFQ